VKKSCPFTLQICHVLYVEANALLYATISRSTGNEASKMASTFDFDENIIHYAYCQRIENPATWFISRVRRDREEETKWSESRSRFLWHQLFEQSERRNRTRKQSEVRRFPPSIPDGSLVFHQPCHPDIYCSKPARIPLPDVFLLPMRRPCPKSNQCTSLCCPQARTIAFIL
jgi:hypothetical protein